MPVLSVARRQMLAERLFLGQTLQVGDLVNEFSVSEDSIRRDLRALAAEGLCRRVYGGAVPIVGAVPEIDQRIDSDVERKGALARAALELIPDGASVFIDTGSANQQLAAALPVYRELNVFTNSLPVASALAGRRDLTLHVIGGKFDPAIGGAVGPTALAQISSLHIDWCFLGACAFSVELGVAVVDEVEAEFKRALFAVSEHMVLLLTDEKIETTAPFTVADAAAVTHCIVEDQKSVRMLESAGASGVGIHIRSADCGK